MLEKRGVKAIDQYATPRFSYPPPEVRARIKTVNHVWKMGDHFYKLSAEYYGNPLYGWVIAFYNQYSTEELLEYGDIIRIPINLQDVLSAIGY
jgi:nucleoid-associated protein YgaU